MGSFLGPYADLTDYVLGNFRVDGLSGRDPAGAPKWRVVCRRCGDCQTLPHAKIAPMIEAKATANLQCANGECLLYRSRTDQPVTLADLRQQERSKAEQAAEAQRVADEQAAKQKARDAQLAALKAEYRFYWNHQIKTKIEMSEIVTFERWQQLSEGTRQMIQDHLRADPGVYFRRL